MKPRPKKVFRLLVELPLEVIWSGSRWRLRAVQAVSVVHLYCRKDALRDEWYLGAAGNAAALRHDLQVLGISLPPGSVMGALFAHLVKLGLAVEMAASLSPVDYPPPDQTHRLYDSGGSDYANGTEIAWGPDGPFGHSMEIIYRPFHLRQSSSICSGS